MTIDDELILELIKPDKKGEVGKDALIFKIVGNKKIKYKLEKSEIHYEFYVDVLSLERRNFKMTPDITVSIPEESKDIAIELENDVGTWDFQRSLRQAKKYQTKFEDTRVIIPKEYEKFAPLYAHEGLRVYLWKTQRLWKCLRCETVTVDEKPFPPQCSKSGCGNKSPVEFRLIGLQGTVIEEFNPQ
ncbi:MAG: hypothetical protein ABSD42_06565 [Candidatus Bathyarchaeia archaeon]|jgi:hypothetical protein